MASIFHLFVFFLFSLYFLPLQSGTAIRTHSGNTIGNALKVPEFFSTDAFQPRGRTAVYRQHGLPELKTAGTFLLLGSVPGVLQAGSSVGMLKNIIITSLLLFLAWLYFYFRSYQKKQRSRIRNIIRSQRRKPDRHTFFTDKVFSNISIEELTDREEEDLLKRRNEPMMTSETEAKLLELLGNFEKSILYNSKNMSLPFLAGELGTNTKYLSHVINRHKSSDFKSYINRLRINYMVEKLMHDEKYRQYKISILADECGFSSHSKFASVFKTVTGLSPSAFIKQLDSENNIFYENHG